jgi:hypothetical protein
MTFTKVSECFNAFLLTLEFRLPHFCFLESASGIDYKATGQRSFDQDVTILNATIKSLATSCSKFPILVALE